MKTVSFNTLPFFALLLALALPAPAVLIEEVIPATSIKVTASTTYGQEQSEQHLMDGSGLSDDRHDGDGGARTMWHSNVNPAASRPAADLPEFPAWVRFDFAAPQKVDAVQVWNHHQANLTNRGFKKARAFTSTDGTTWKARNLELPPGNGEPVLVALEATSPVVSIILAADSNHGGDCYGLSEVRFLTRREVANPPLPTGMTCVPQPFYGHRPDGKAGREILITLQGAKLYAASRVEVDCAGVKETTELPANPRGFSQLNLLLPAAVTNACVATITLTAAETSLRKVVEVPECRFWEFHIVNQTHLDIGYTHTQEDVLKLQVQHLKTAMKYIEQTKDYPIESQFKFHPEGMWAVDEFMRAESAEDKARFIEDCRKRQIHIDVLYAQAMTGMYTEEEMFELMSAAKRFEREHKVPVISAMQSDVPGYTWGLSAALAHHGVSYLSLGPNFFWGGGGHRAGHTFDWADRPFWWVDPSGRHKTLFWMTGWGYSGFHSGRQDIPDSLVFDYIKKLEEKGYPYDMVMWRYSVGGDNGPPRIELSHRIKQWNERYAWPKLVMARNSDVMEAFAKRYGDKIPVMKGDFTPYWEDGAASTSKATGANRVACERIAQAQILWAMLQPGLKLHERFDTAWNKMVMYDEHTWGAHNSISRPDDPFAVRQDKYKQAYAFDGVTLTDALLKDIAPPGPGASVDIHNTAAWLRGGLILLPAKQSAAGDTVKDEAGRVVPSQRLGSGELAFRASDVPAFGTRRYTLHPGAAAGVAGAAGAAKAEGLRLTNGLLTLEIDPQSGAIRSLQRTGVAGEWVDTTKAEGLNTHLYIIGRNADQGRARVVGPAKVVVEDAGPLVATLRIESDAPGCNKLTRRVRLVDGLDHVELVNTTEKLKERRPEGLYFGFPFQLPGAIARVDVPWAVVQVEKDQLPGANRNFYCVQRWVDLSTADRGVTWVTVDAPMVQFDPIKIAQPFGIQHWREHIEPGPFFWSWTMNNHWETNYKADQEGEITFRYALRPHAGGYDAVAAQRFGRDICQPLLAVSADPAKPVAKPLLDLKDASGIVVTQVRPSRDGKATMVRLFNVAGETQNARLVWNRPVGATWISNPMEDRVKPAPSSVELAPMEIITLRVENGG